MVLEKLKYIVGRSHTKPVFVIGTGRSGTHWLGYSLEAHPEIYATIEAQPMFDLSTRIALNETLESRLLVKLLAVYKFQLLKAAPRIYMDKTHPNIWIAEKLHRAFPHARFLGIERNPYATVASMMKHGGVSAWHRRWREFPVPNRFLGITEEIAPLYDDLPFASQCAMRWQAHHNKLNELKGTLGPALLTVSYEEFAHNPKEVTEGIQHFLGLRAPIPVPEVKVDSLDKWRDALSDSDVANIERVVGFPPTEPRFAG